MHYYGGEYRVWAVASIPTPEQEDERRVHRELDRLRQYRTAHGVRIRSLLVPDFVAGNKIRVLCPLALCGRKRGVPVLRRRGANI